MKRYTFRVYTKDDPDDGFSVCEEAMDEQSARREILHDYYDVIELVLIKVENVQ